MVIQPGEPITLELWNHLVAQGYDISDDSNHRLLRGGVRDIEDFIINNGANHYAYVLDKLPQEYRERYSKEKWGLVVLSNSTGKDPLSAQAINFFGEEMLRWYMEYITRYCGDAVVKLATYRTVSTMTTERDTMEAQLSALEAHFEQTFVVKTIQAI